LILKNVRILNHSLIPIDYYKKASEICNTIDADDTVFVAFTEYIRGKLWTGDKKLIKGLTDKRFERLITTHDLYQDFIFRHKNKKQ